MLTVISFTDRGEILGKSLADGLARKGEKAVSQRYPSKGGAEYIRDAFYASDGLIFIGACGIAVRMIAPYINDKLSDPAVVVIDERAFHAVSLLSGHFGGANRLACLCAQITGAELVITTATDINGLFAVDRFACQNDLAITGTDPRKRMKHISAAILSGNRIPVYMDNLIEHDDIPGELFEVCDIGKAEKDGGFLISIKNHTGVSLQLVPRCVSIGAGCKKGIPGSALGSMVRVMLSDNGISPLSVEKTATIDIKKDEPAIAELSAALGVPVFFYSAGELNSVQGTKSSSQFVKSVAGTDCVCERAAVKAANDGRLIIEKQARDGMTAAAAVRPVSVSFKAEVL